MTFVFAAGVALLVAAALVALSGRRRRTTRPGRQAEALDVLRRITRPDEVGAPLRRAGARQPPPTLEAPTYTAADWGTEGNWSHHRPAAPRRPSRYVFDDLSSTYDIPRVGDIPPTRPQGAERPPVAPWAALPGYWPNAAAPSRSGTHRPPPRRRPAAQRPAGGRAWARAVEVAVALDVLAAAVAGGLWLGERSGKPAGGARVAQGAAGAGPSGQAGNSGNAGQAGNAGAGKGTRSRVAGGQPAGRGAQPQAAGRAGRQAGQLAGRRRGATRRGRVAAQRRKAPARLPAGATPVLSAVSPPAGAPGERVTLRGKGLFSPDGLITVLFGSAQAVVSCPTETTCDATVPSRTQARGHRVLVTLTTEAGTSNRLAFSYR
jgi:hypothetical protein